MTREPTPRVSAAQLARLIPDLSERDWAILRFLARHKFASTPHLRRVFFTTHATPTAAIRACVRVLDRHLHHRLLARLDRRVGGLKHGSASFIWHLDVVGHRLLSDASDAARRRFTSPSPQFLDHTLAITEAHASLHEASNVTDLTLTAVEVEVEAWRPYVDGHGVATILKPDLYVQVASASYDDHWYIEIDRGTEHLPVLLAKCRAYAAYRATGRAQTEYGVFPRILWVLPIQARAGRLRAAILNDPGLDKRLFAFTTPSRMVETILGDEATERSNEATS